MTKKTRRFREVNPAALPSNRRKKVSSYFDDSDSDDDFLTRIPKKTEKPTLTASIDGLEPLSDLDKSDGSEDTILRLSSQTRAREKDKLERANAEIERQFRGTEGSSRLGMGPRNYYPNPSADEAKQILQDLQHTTFRCVKNSEDLLSLSTFAKSEECASVLGDDVIPIEEKEIKTEDSTSEF